MEQDEVDIPVRVAYDRSRNKKRRLLPMMKRCMFLELPVELRFWVYSYVLPDRQYYRYTECSPRGYTSTPFTNLMLVNKQLSADIISWRLTNVHTECNSMRALHEFLRYNESFLARNLRDVTLSLTDNHPIQDIELWVVEEGTQWLANMRWGRSPGSYADFRQRASQLALKTFTLNVAWDRREEDEHHLDEQMDIWLDESDRLLAAVPVGIAPGGTYLIDVPGHDVSVAKLFRQTSDGLQLEMVKTHKHCDNWVLKGEVKEEVKRVFYENGQIRRTEVSTDDGQTDI